MVDACEDNLRMKCKLVMNEHGQTYLANFLSRGTETGSTPVVPSNRKWSGTALSKADKEDDDDGDSDEDDDDDDKNNPAKQSLRIASRYVSL
jgi:hypothetical protein